MNWSHSVRRANTATWGKGGNPRIGKCRKPLDSSRGVGPWRMAIANSSQFRPGVTWGGCLGGAQIVV